MASTQQITQASDGISPLHAGHVLVGDSACPGMADSGSTFQVADYTVAKNDLRGERPSPICNPRESVRAVPRPGVPLRAVSMFTDIRESTAMTQRLGVVRMLRLLRDFFGEVESRVKDHGGSMRNYNGDGGLALFCGQGRADRALSAALSVQRFTQVFAATVPEYEPHRRLDDVGHLSFGVGIGLDDGEVAMGLVGDKPGPEVWVGAGIAAKLSAEADPGSIVMTHEMFAGIKRGTAEESPVCVLTTGKMVGGGVRRIHVISAQQVSLRPDPANPGAVSPAS
jgi:adenylate cyclase